MTYSTYLHPPGIVCALGSNLNEVAAELFSNKPKPLTLTDRFTPGMTLPIGLTSPIEDEPVINSKTDNSFNNRLLLRAINQIHLQIEELKNTFAPHRIGVVLGTSTSGIREAEKAFEEQLQSGKLAADYDYGQQEIGSASQFLARHLGLSGPAITISTACSSSAKALASARRLIQANICDAVICGGVDSLCRLTVNGFLSLNSVSVNTCNPFSVNRDGINIGEAACVFIMSKKPSPVALSGSGETSDAYHISAPQPEGLGAKQAIKEALAEAQLTASQVDYINLHGTATPQNDSMESAAIHAIFGEHTLCSSTKPLTGHTLGAAGAIEAAFCWLALTNDGQLPPHWWDEQTDSSLSPLKFVKLDSRTEQKPRHALSTSFAFGGNNVALLFSATEACRY